MHSIVCLKYKFLIYDYINYSWVLWLNEINSQYKLSGIDRSNTDTCIRIDTCHEILRIWHASGNSSYLSVAWKSALQSKLFCNTLFSYVYVRRGEPRLFEVRLIGYHRRWTTSIFQFLGVNDCIARFFSKFSSSAVSRNRSH